MSRISYRFMAITLFSLLSWSSLANIEVRIYKPDVVNEDDLEITVPMASGGETFNLKVDLPSDDATSISSAAKTYVPVLGDSGTTEASLYSLNGSSKASSLPVASIGTPPSASLTFEKEITMTAGGNNDYYLYAAVSNNPNSDDWRVIGKNTSSIQSPVTEARYKISFSLEDFCNFSDVNDCADLAGSADETMAEVYFFVSTSDLSNNTPINPEDSEYDHGVYYEVSLSSNIHENVEVSIEGLRRGDQSLNLEYNSNQTIDDFDRVIVARYLGSGPHTGDVRIGDAGELKLFGNSKADEFSSEEEGSLRVEPLENDQEAILSVAFVDKFNFVTKLSPSESGTPLAIETLLEEQSCFFFTAGFAREHEVIDQLKKFRDQVLMKSPIGKTFVQVYYQIAPKYAPYIVDKPLLQSFVRMVAYSFVFLIDYFVVILLSLLGLCILAFGTIFCRNGVFKPRQKA